MEILIECVDCCVADEMYVFSASNKRVTVQLLGKDKIQDKLSRFEELTAASLSYLGVSTPGDPCQIGTIVPSKLVLFFSNVCSLDTLFYLDASIYS